MRYLHLALVGFTWLAVACSDDTSDVTGGSGGQTSSGGSAGAEPTSGGAGGATSSTSTTSTTSSSGGAGGGVAGLSCSQTDCTAAPQEHTCSCAETCEFCEGGDCTTYDYVAECVDGIAGLSCTCKVDGAVIGSCSAGGTCSGEITIAAGNCCAEFLHP